MQYVVFARDRRRKKKQMKMILFIMAMIAVLIGTILMWKPQHNSNEVPINLPVNSQKNESFPLQTSESTKALLVAENANIPSDSLDTTQATPQQIDVPVEQEVVLESQQPAVEIAEKVELPPEEAEQVQQNSDGMPANEQAQQPLAEISHDSLSKDQDLTYIEIQEGELDEPESTEPIDEGATSYEDDFVAEDDVDDETILKIQAEAAKKAEEEKQKADVLSPEAEEALDSFLDVADQAIRIQNQFSYTVTRGDKLKDVLEQSGLSTATARVLEQKFPQLANLTQGQQFYWILGKDGELEYMNWLVSEKEEKIFERKSKSQFSVQTIQKKGIWKQDVVKGTFNSDFTSTLKAQGFSTRQINQLAAGIQWQVSTNKIKKGDKFVILVKREYINGKVTELGNVEAIHILTGGKSYYAIQADNGRYYSRHGETLGKGFARYPLQFTPRISSHFNPRRLHPVTRRVAPHKGVDFGVRIGTPIIAPADGIVEHVAYQANGAGRYIKLRHGRQYTTVYMHLSKSLVRVGQSVKKGERIALSGNTGRSTGPHLHYEFHINGRPVNPMTVKLPGTGSGMPESERKAFLAKARLIEGKLRL